MMSKKSFQVSGWSNGVTGGLGFRISKKDRDIYFPKNIKLITLHMPRMNEPLVIDLSGKDGFWNKCPELMDKQTKKWMLENGYEKDGKHWTYRNPPKFTLTEISQGEFKLTE